MAAAAWLSVAVHAAGGVWVARTNGITPPQPAAFEPLEVSFSIASEKPKTRPRPVNARVVKPEPPRETTAKDIVPAPETTTRETTRRSLARVETLTRATVLYNPKPPYPLAAHRRGIQGRVVLSVWVTAGGIAGSVHVKRSSGYPVLDAAAARAVRRWRFAPARRGQRTVAARVDVPVVFRLNGPISN